MKTEERTYPDLVESTRAEVSASDELHSEDVVIAEDWATESGPTDQVSTIPPEELDRSGRHVSGRVSAQNERKTEERKVVEVETERSERGRRSTLVSPIPAMVAEWMRKETDGGIPVARDPAAPDQGGGDLTRRLGDSSERERLERESMAYTVEVVDDGNAERRQRAARHIDRARACLDADDITGAADAAEEALDEADQAAPPGIVEVIEPARPLLNRIFATFVGSLAEVPVLARRLEEIAGMPLDERERVLLGRIDGIRSLDEIFDGARVPAADALRITASLLRAGVIRVV